MAHYCRNEPHLADNMRSDSVSAQWWIFPLNSKAGVALDFNISMKYPVLSDFLSVIGSLKTSHKHLSQRWFWDHLMGFMTPRKENHFLTFKHLCWREEGSFLLCLRRGAYRRLKVLHFVLHLRHSSSYLFICLFIWCFFYIYLGLIYFDKYGVFVCSW